PSLAQAFPDVVHVGPPLLDPASPPSAPASPPPPPPIAPHLPATHVSVQHCDAPLGHEPPIVTHCVALHDPFTHDPLQQSVPTAHPCPALPHTPSDVAHWLFKQRCEQQSD